MNHTLQTALAWFGGISALGYSLVGAWICAVAAVDARRIHANRAALRARRAPLTETEIAAVDFDAGLAKLTKENGR
jgi:hypothetical protein